MMQLVTGFLGSASLGTVATATAGYLIEERGMRIYNTPARIAGQLVGGMMARVPLALYAASLPALGLGVGAAVFLTPAVMGLVAMNVGKGSLQTGLFIALRGIWTAVAVATFALALALFATVCTMPLTASSVGLGVLYGMGVLLNGGMAHWRVICNIVNPIRNWIVPAQPLADGVK